MQKRVEAAQCRSESRTCSELIYGSVSAANVCFRDVASFAADTIGILDINSHVADLR